MTVDEGRQTLSLAPGTPMPIPSGTGAACSVIDTVPNCDATNERDAAPRAPKNAVQVTVVGDVVAVGVVVASLPHAVLVSTTATLSSPSRRIATLTDG